MDVAELVAHARREFALPLTAVDVVSGEDEHAVVLRAVTADGSEFALKTSDGDLSTGALVSAHLARRGVHAVPTPLPARSGRPWSQLGTHQVTLTPWVRGRAGAAGGLTASRWHAFGRALAQVHAAGVTPAIQERLPVEDYVTPAAASVRSLGSRMGAPRHRDDDSAVRELSRHWFGVSDAVTVIVEQTEALGRLLRGSPAPLVLTHGDAHLFNVVVDDDTGALSLIDWGGTASARRERDLMFVIGGVLTQAPVTADEQSSFFDGYGDWEVDPMCLTYYRCSWAVQDVMSYASQVLDGSRPHPERAHALRLFEDLLQPTGIVSTALESLRWIGRLER